MGIFFNRLEIIVVNTATIIVILVDVVVSLILLLRLLRQVTVHVPHVVKVDINPRPHQIHHVLNLLKVPTDSPEMARCPTGSRGEKIHCLLQVNIGHVGEYQLLL